MIDQNVIVFIGWKILEENNHLEQFAEEDYCFKLVDKNILKMDRR